MDKERFEELERRGLYYVYRRVSDEEREEYFAYHRQREGWREAAQKNGKMCGECGAALGDEDAVYRYKPLLNRGRYSSTTYRRKPTLDAIPLCEECAPDWLPELQTRVYTLHVYSHRAPCETCGREVYFVSSHEEEPDARVFCSNMCRARRRSKWAEPPREHTCEACGATFTTRRSDARFCSSACRQRAYRQRLRV